ncbi:phytoene dehydrogenase-like protein [Streptomyces sp. SPB4]|nr:phytoene dehydrogenase-like protein [Streptomyces sp. SPB4]
MTTADPSRSPAGTESAWAHTHLPQHFTRDAGPDRIMGRWDAGEQEAMTDRIEAQVGLSLAAVSAHPGGGVHGAPGANAARAALRARGLRFLFQRVQRI